MCMLEIKSISYDYDESADAIIYHGSCLELLKKIPENTIKLVVTSPPYNIGKEYEKRLKLDRYVEQQNLIIKECFRVLHPEGSICWQVGNYVQQGEIIPLDTILYPFFRDLGLKLRNRIIWGFEHGLHCSKRFSGRYETINWFTKSDDYTFNLDPVRVPQKYPGKKYFKGPKAGQYSCNPLGKNPGDIWNIPDVKSNHIEKTEHPCQFPVELIERLVLSLTDVGDKVFDPFSGTGTTIIAAIRHNRIGIGSEVMQKYIELSKDRVQMEIEGTLKTRPMNKPIYDPKATNSKITKSPWENINGNGKQLELLNEKGSV